MDILFAILRFKKKKNCVKNAALNFSISCEVLTKEMLLRSYGNTHIL